MSFDPHLSTRAAILDYFTARRGRFPDLPARVEAFFGRPTLATGRELLRTYFRSHTTGDIASLRMATAAFADKRASDACGGRIHPRETRFAARGHRRRGRTRTTGRSASTNSCWTMIEAATGFKFRLHVYWPRGELRVVLERLHLHRFEMASAIVTGELTNHIWRVTGFNPDNDVLKGMTVAEPNPDFAGDIPVA